MSPPPELLSEMLPCIVPPYNEMGSPPLATSFFPQQTPLAPEMSSPQSQPSLSVCSALWCHWLMAFFISLFSSLVSLAHAFISNRVDDCNGLFKDVHTVSAY